MARVLARRLDGAVAIDWPATLGEAHLLLNRERVPSYAEALAVTCARVPPAIDPKRPDRVTIDWAGAAQAAAGAT